jgi:SAM-dependent methyltransferase
LSTHWSEYHAKWSRLGPPLRPHANVVAGMQRVLARHSGPTLLLGVTPELADVGASVTAVDRNPGMIRGIWPGDSATRRALTADWLDLPLEPNSFVAAVGDGSLNALTHPDGYQRLHAELARVLKPGARLVLRVFRRPDDCEALTDVCADARAGRIASFHAFKWRFAMALTAKGMSSNIAVKAIHRAFVAEFPDRTELARSTGWDPSDIETIDVYRESDEIYSFPTGSELLSVPAPFIDAHFEDAGSYELAERCPLLVVDRAH